MNYSFFYGSNMASSKPNLFFSLLERILLICNDIQTQSNHNAHKPDHRYYRDRCHHPFLDQKDRRKNLHHMCFSLHYQSSLYFIILVHLFLWFSIGTMVVLVIANVDGNIIGDEIDLETINEFNESISGQTNFQYRNSSDFYLLNFSLPPNRLANTTDPYVFKEQVCESVDIRNSVSHFKKLANCTIIEGHLRIVLIDNGIAADYENIQFPMLREVTDYVLFFRVMGLQSLAKMFPNLSVIRGRKLLHNYAFVIYEMLHLQEIGLKNLTSILRGDIRIQKNPNLCFVDTIDWSRIAQSSLISDNKDQNLCPNCPENCPIVSARSSNGKKIGDVFDRVCWTSDVCQKHACLDECESLNRTCSNTGSCCPEQCLGGCIADPLNPIEHICISCKNYVYDHRCFKSCPSDSYAFFDRRCLTENECNKLSTVSKKYKAFMGECDYKCPVGHIEDPSNPHLCLECGENCPKICESSQISNIAQAQQLKGCTVINGSLEIYINNQGAQIVKELEENLKDLVEITGFLKIARSFPLVTINFLKKLRIIRGQILERNSYSLLILDNPNLQDLWTFKEDEFLINNEKRIKILNGKIFVHINPKLCFVKIRNMIKYVDIVDLKLPWDERDVSTHSNGDKVPCNVFDLNVEIKGITSEMLLIKFDNFKIHMEDPRSLLGYLIYYREAEHRNVTVFDGQDACSNNEWTVVEFDTMKDDDGQDYHEHVIAELKPYTQYALYIKTYTIDTATKGAQSEIIYFHTSPDVPSQPLNLFAKAEKHNSIYVKWDPPSKPNGEVTLYHVKASKDELQIIHRDYCSETFTKKETVKPLVIQEPKINHWLQGINNTDFKQEIDVKTKSSSQTKQDLSKQCCSCRNDDSTKIKPTDVEQSINFEDYLINTVYVKRIVSVDKEKRRKRQLNKTDEYLTTTPFSSIYPNISNYNYEFNINDTSHDNLTISSPKISRKWHYNGIVEKKLNVLIENLEHFTEYTIEVKACHDANEFCSVTAITSVKTLPLPGADDIDERTMSYFIDNSTINNKFKFVHITWQEPPSPNGFIISYQIEYKRITEDHSKSIVAPSCFTRDQYERNDYGYTLELAAGNYSIRLRARSLANYGNWTREFIIYIEDSEYSNFKYLIIVAVLIILLTILIILFLKIRISQSKLDYMSVNPDYINTALVYKADPKWEIPRDKITMIRELGEGSFGKVFESEYTQNSVAKRCAVKILNKNASARDRINFLKEADMMKSFTDCHHVVKLLGICSKDQPFLVLMEIMTKGDLRNYLRNNRPDNQDNSNPQLPTLSQIYRMSIEIADGMAYLASKKFVHRDLAARNCMLSEDLTVKIGDFGMTRDICESDYYRKGDKGFLPVRWMSPESLQDGIFTTYSDVWAFGVVLWEIVTLASQPYQGLSNVEVLKFVIDGNHMPPPKDCPDVLYKLMLICWNKKPKARPTFTRIIEILLDYVDRKSFMKVCFYDPKRCDNADDNSVSDENQAIKDDSLRPLKSSNNINDNASDSEDVSSVNDQLTDEDMNVRFFPLGGRLFYSDVVEDYPQIGNNDNLIKTSNQKENNNEEQIDQSSISHPAVELDSVLTIKFSDQIENHQNDSIQNEKNSRTNIEPNSIISSTNMNKEKKAMNMINGRLVDTSIV
ncbi:Insulin receptor [Sarcoptes scabiei]|uniref:receptor protein-tyrosine kinase n=1 Tax=Sarcoptes scabiei TaxID=52283 RepID=A0A834VE78_SARSC|nr:Insulin receptor [Sarcoptes scabiei]